MYGQTEATARIAWLPPEKLFEHTNCIGQAIAGGKLGFGISVAIILAQNLNKWVNSFIKVQM